MLGSIDQSYCLDLLNAIIESDSQKVLSIIENMSQYSPNYAEVMSDWLTLMHKIAVTQAGMGFTSGTDVSETVGFDDENSLENLANRASPESIQLYYQLALVAKKDLAFAPHPRQGFEMAFLRVLAFKPKTVKSVKSKPLESKSTSSQPITSKLTAEVAPSTEKKNSLN
ncbi:MAG: hypothetical protein COB38_06360 [Gammaproteobacteria bacterium]|nr:MAG: hypothetical protein COB38_06360 [Gammaproteobacteria bacterium]